MLILAPTGSDEIAAGLRNDWFTLCPDIPRFGVDGRMTITIFRTPIIRPILAGIARLVLHLIGWRMVGAPPDTRRLVLIGAPHTSNWDFPLMLMAVLVAQADVHWMGKDTLFPRVLGNVMLWLGGIPIDRSKANNTVAQMVERFRGESDLILLIPPEGTRARVERWKTGFYHIACGAEVPILLGFVDAATKQIGFGPLFYPTGDVDADLPKIQQFYADKTGLRAR